MDLLMHKTIVADSAQELDDRVTQMMRSGWRPDGSLVLLPHGAVRPGFSWVRTLVRVAP